MRKARIAVLTLAVACWLNIFAPYATSQAAPSTEPLAWSTDSVGPRRFIAVPGRRALISGYSSQGLEVWAYPLQILEGYNPSFRVEGASSEIEGLSILRRIVYTPESVTRIYAGPDFIVRERLFVPLDEAGAIITYEVDGARPLEIRVHFVPVLNLMWPAAIGGQDTTWDQAASGYILGEPTKRYRAAIISSEIVAHDETSNVANDVRSQRGLSFTLRAGGHSPRSVRVAIAASLEKNGDPVLPARKLLSSADTFEQEVAAHSLDRRAHVLQIETPDPDVNRALAWSQVAMDQFWVCNTDLGCGLVAGYGPTRGARRPQYAWFFAGDALVGMEALLSEGEYSRAREVLAFVTKYQDPASGMIWHELSQSAGQLDWAGKYPYMYVHVDITFDYLNAWSSYISATGDTKFLASHWTFIGGAYKYCAALVDPQDGLPRIPATKQGGNEQESLSDELRLSVSWVDASDSFARLAALLGKKQQAEEARRMNQRARASIAKRYWSDQEHVWISGTTREGKPVIDRRVVPESVFADGLFIDEQRREMLDELSSWEYQTDWGTRGVPSTSERYDPDAYASGSVWGIGTASMSVAAWAEHRPATAFPIWSALVPWSSLDAIGHMHEALAGNFYHEEEESVPEQMWSSAGFITSAVHGMLGIAVDAEKKQLTFSPHLPPAWDKMSLRNVRVGESLLRFTLSQTDAGIDLEAQNDGPPVSLVFTPEIPLGAHDLIAVLDRRPLSPSLQLHAQDTHARVGTSLPTGASHLSLRYKGGVSILLPAQPVLVGNPSTGIKIVGVELHKREYSVKLDQVASRSCSFLIRTPWRIAHVDGASIELAGVGLYRVTLGASASATDLHYNRTQVVVVFESSP
ncbi:MAG TPA: glycosyl hydrolase family 65 protein [Acidobacteriaceae bacterium]|nr:glycosyl hydrolase family 65 protein [Acidobacteriaceae bacterium]